jgi:hypothetical protein
MENRLRSTFDGMIVGSISGMILVLINSFWGINPTNSPYDIVMTCLVSGAMVGWTLENSFQMFGLLNGLLTSFTAMFLMAIGALPFALFHATVTSTPLAFDGNEVTNSALALLLISSVVGAVYQNLTMEAKAAPAQLMTPQVSIDQ